jgi:hypothetical protein
MSAQLSTVCILSENPCREIVEGRAPKKFLRCVPVREFTCPPAPPETTPAFEPPSADTIKKFLTKESA